MHLVILLFPDGSPPSPRWRRVMWSYVAMVGCYLACTYAAVIIAVAGHRTRIDANGTPAFINHPVCLEVAGRYGLVVRAVRLTERPMAVDGLVIDQDPRPPTRPHRGDKLTVQVWHPPARSR